MNFLASQLAVYSGWALCMKPSEGLVQRKLLSKLETDSRPHSRSRIYMDMVPYFSQSQL